MAETVRELVGSALYLAGETFASIPIPVAVVVESEAVAVECGLEPRAGIDQNHGVVDEVFLQEFRRKYR